MNWKILLILLSGFICSEEKKEDQSIDETSKTLELLNSQAKEPIVLSPEVGELIQNAIKEEVERKVREERGQLWNISAQRLFSWLWGTQDKQTAQKTKEKTDKEEPKSEDITQTEELQESQKLSDTARNVKKVFVTEEERKSQLPPFIPKKTERSMEVENEKSKEKPKEFEILNENAIFDESSSSTSRIFSIRSSDNKSTETKPKDSQNNETGKSKQAEESSESKICFDCKLAKKKQSENSGIGSCCTRRDSRQSLLKVKSTEEGHTQPIDDYKSNKSDECKHFGIFEDGTQEMAQNPTLTDSPILDGTEKHDSSSIEETDNLNSTLVIDKNTEDTQKTIFAECSGICSVDPSNDSNHTLLYLPNRFRTSHHKGLRFKFHREEVKLLHLHSDFERSADYNEELEDTELYSELAENVNKIHERKRFSPIIEKESSIFPHVDKKEEEKNEETGLERTTFNFQKILENRMKLLEFVEQKSDESEEKVFEKESERIFREKEQTEPENQLPFSHLKRKLSSQEPFDPKIQEQSLCTEKHEEQEKVFTPLKREDEHTDLSIESPKTETSLVKPPEDQTKTKEDETSESTGFPSNDQMNEEIRFLQNGPADQTEKELKEKEEVATKNHQAAKDENCEKEKSSDEKQPSDDNRLKGTRKS